VLKVVTLVGFASDATPLWRISHEKELAGLRTPLESDRNHSGTNEGDTMASKKD
tara:strand:- start:719 stop:880 length:162 start_codon:yes stop_codon:yes gene_type:complete